MTMKSHLFNNDLPVSILFRRNFYIDLSDDEVTQVLLISQSGGKEHICISFLFLLIEHYFIVQLTIKN